jgi:TRAP-type C4-dicarboxylate transport system permease small subunit
MTEPEHPGGVLQALLVKAIATLENISSVAIAIMMVLTFVDVIGRYIFHSPVFGAGEMISSLLAIVIFAGLGVTNARDDHIVVELIDSQIRRMAPRLYDAVIQLFSVLAMGLIAFVLCEHALTSYHQEARTYVLEIPLFLTTGLVALLAFVSTLSMIAGIYLRMQSPGGNKMEHGL